MAILVGAYVASVEARNRGRDSQIIWDALPWVLIFGIVGARAYHVGHLWNFYRQNLEQILFLWRGGLGIYGGILGGLIGLFVWARGPVIKAAEAASSGVKAWDLLDIAAPGMAIGQVIGRFANYFNQELYGWPTDLPWGIYINPENRFPGLENFEYFHPLFLYEALWCLLGFLVLLGTYNGGDHKGRSYLTGERFLGYLSFYAVGRFFLESMRIESWMVGGARVAQVVSVMIVFGSATMAVLRRAKGKNSKSETRSSK